MAIPPRLVQYLGHIPFFHHKTTSSLTLCFIPGFRSSFQTSRKSDHLYLWCRNHNVSYLTWDHPEETSVQDWCQQGQDMITSQLSNNSTQQQRLLFVGASLGMWLAIRIAHSLSLHNKHPGVTNSTTNTIYIQGIIGIGGAVDTTERWLQELHNMNTKTTTKASVLLNDGKIWRRPSEYDSNGYYDIPVSFLEKSQHALILSNNDISSISYPVHLIHGALDQDVPLQHVHHLLYWLKERHPSSSSSSSCTPIHLHLVQDGNHRLSRPQDLMLLDKILNTCTADVP